MASDIFAKLGDIKGESLDDKHKDEIEVLSWSWGVSNAGAAEGGGGGGRARRASTTFPSPTRSTRRRRCLMQGVRYRCAHEGSDDHPSEGRQGPAGVPHHQDERRDHHQRDTRRQRRAATSESVSLAFAKVDLEYKPQKADGSLDAGIHFKYDIKGNKEG